VPDATRLVLRPCDVFAGNLELGDLQPVGRILVAALRAGLVVHLRRAEVARRAQALGVHVADDAVGVVHVLVDRLQRQREGLAGIGRETNLLALLAFPLPSGWRGWLKWSAAAALAICPFLLWQDYVWSIYRGSSVSAGAEHFVLPFTAYLDKWISTLGAVHTLGLVSPAGVTVPVLVALTVQAAFVAWSVQWREPWWRVAAGWAVLMFFVDPPVWDGYPGAITRIVLPLKFGFNVLVARRASPHFWVWWTAGNLDLIASLHQ